MIMKNQSHLLFLILAMFTCILTSSCGGDNKVRLSWSEVKPEEQGKFKVNFYVENSGSMNGYMCAGSEFKNVVHYYANELEDIADTTSLYFINSQIIPYRGDIDDYTLGMTPSKFDSYGGVTSSSSIDKMLGLVVDNIDSNTVSIFISDCILAVPFGEADKYFSMAKDNVKKVFVKALKKDKNLGVDVLCLKSQFNGTYYQYGKAPIKVDHPRPYYVWIVGPQSLIGLIDKKIDKSELQGYKNEVGYSTCSRIPFTVVNEHGKAGTATSVQSQVKGRKARFILRADLSSCLQNEAVLEDPGNYQTDPKVMIEQVRKTNMPGYTHEMFLAIFDNAHLDENIVLKRQPMPSWVSKISDVAGQDLNKTAGIKYIIGGVSDAYNNVAQQNGIKISIK